MELRCRRCGREGSRGFTTAPGQHPSTLRFFAVCSSSTACDKRSSKMVRDTVRAAEEMTLAMAEYIEEEEYEGDE